MSDDPAVPDLDALQAEVERRAATLQGAALADDDALAEHAEAAAGRADPPDLTELRAAMAALGSAPPVPAATPAADGRRRPREAGGDPRVEALVTRLDATERALAAAVEVLTAPGHRHRDLEGELDAIRGRLRRGERTGPWPEAANDLLRRLEDLEEAERRRGHAPWYPSERFVAAFRGDEAALQARYADLVARLVEHGGPVLDLGCGDGLVLDLLVGAGLPASGVELDPAVAAPAIARGLDVTVGDAIEHLRSSGPGSLGGLVALQVVEHLGPQDLLELVALSADRVRAGGLVVVETINPSSFYVYSHALWLDPTHARPVHPAYLEFLFREVGFRSVTSELRSPTPEGERLPFVEGADDRLVATLNRCIAQLNDLLYGAQDYAVLAVR